ncbi:MAG: RES family NAD+ phosphorylase [Spongiibacteraceae bacterium]
MVIDIKDLDVIQINETTYRLIPSRFPPIDLFERVSTPEEFDLLHEIESLTNDRLRDEVGDISLVAKEDRIAGNGSGYIMAAFTHAKTKGGGGRFDKGYGIYYCAKDLVTAFEETKYHRAQFFRDFNSGPTRIDMRSLVADLNKELHTIYGKQDEYPDIYHPDDYTASQSLGKELKKSNSWGIKYSSVRNIAGTCYGVFRPPALSNCRQSKHYEYQFDGHVISHVIEKKSAG